MFAVHYQHHIQLIPGLDGQQWKMGSHSLVVQRESKFRRAVINKAGNLLGLGFDQAESTPGKLQDKFRNARQ